MSAANRLVRNSSNSDRFRRRWLEGGGWTPSAAGASCDRHDFPRIHDVVRVERALDGSHGPQRRASQLAREVFHLALADAVLAGARAIHGECALDQPLAQRLRGLDL